MFLDKVLVPYTDYVAKNMYNPQVINKFYTQLKYVTCNLISVLLWIIGAFSLIQLAEIIKHHIPQYSVLRRTKLSEDKNERGELQK